MDRFEMRFSDENDIMGEWSEVNDHESVGKNVFDNHGGRFNRYVRLVRYEYIGGSCVEYRRIKEK